MLAAPLIPERMRGLNASAVAAMALRCGGETVAVGDLFEVSGAGSEEEALVLGGDLRGFDFIGAGMTSGEIEVRGDVGAWAGAEMAGGVLRILGDAGARLGSAYPGTRVGMTGGEIVVTGDAGEEAGAGMRRGLVAVGGRTGNGAGLRMLAGTVIALGGIGDEAGLGNKRGSLVVRSDARAVAGYAYRHSLPSTGPASPAAPGARARPDRGRRAAAGAWARWSGDRTELGRGEILIFDGEEEGQ